MSALDDRRQAAREAFWNADQRYVRTVAIDAAIETATRVQITPELCETYMAGERAPEAVFVRKGEAGLRAALTAAGFEVEA
jgi:hypothetical protein